MDLLIYPENPVITPDDIQFLCEGIPKYDRLGFSTYTLRCGWADLSDSLKWIDYPDDELAVRAQAWLFFGLISEFCDEIIPCAVCRKDSMPGGFSRVSAAGLSKLLEKQLPNDTKNCLRSSRAEDQFIRKLKFCLREALRCSEILDHRVSIEDGLLSKISFSIRVLL